MVKHVRTITCLVVFGSRCSKDVDVNVGEIAGGDESKVIDRDWGNGAAADRAGTFIFRRRTSRKITDTGG